MKLDSISPEFETNKQDADLFLALQPRHSYKLLTFVILDHKTKVISVNYLENWDWLSESWVDNFPLIPDLKMIVFWCLIQDDVTLHKVILFSSYVIEKGVCYLALCEAGFPKKLAFAYLEDLEGEFSEQYGAKVPSVSRPYSFIEFGE